MPGSQMTTAQARAVDPILTEHALGYQDPAFSGHELFPSVDVLTHGGKLLNFDDQITEVTDTLRAPGADAAQIQLKYSTKSFALETHGLDAVVPRELWNDATAAPVRSLGERAVNRALSPVQRNLEIAQAAIARNAANYAAGHKVALSGATLWSASGVDPTEDILVGVNAVELDSGGTNIVVLIPSDVMSVLRTNVALKDNIKYTQRGVITEDVLAALWGVKKVVVARSLKKVAGVRQRIWGKDVVIAHVPEMSHYDEPSFGYSFRLRGTPTVEMPYYRKANRSWIYPVDADYQAQMTMPEAGYLIQTAVA